MKIIILHDSIAPGARADEADAVVQAAVVSAALAELGHQAQALPLTLDLDAARRALRAARPDLVFNLVESLGGHGRLIHLAPALLEALRIPYTGAPAEAMSATSSKLFAKRMLRAAGLPTPAWVEMESAGADEGAGPFTPGRFIVKSVWEHASVGLDEDSVIAARGADELRAAIAARLHALGGEGFAEAYIDGREFNLALLGGAADAADSASPEILPRAEIVFDGYGATKPKVVGYRAKWDAASYEYHHTPRRYDFPAADAPLLAALSELAIACWRLFRLRGYARVDFRVDQAGRPWILEVNTNPCLSTDAGFAAALQRAEISIARAVERIMNDTLAKEAARCRQ